MGVEGAGHRRLKKLLRRLSMEAMRMDSDETTRVAISTVMTTRSQNPAATVRPTEAVVRRFPLSETGVGHTS
jgi:hypothetical protein